MSRSEFSKNKPILCARCGAKENRTAAALYVEGVLVGYRRDGGNLPCRGWICEDHLVSMLNDEGLEIRSQRVVPADVLAAWQEIVGGYKAVRH